MKEFVLIGKMYFDATDIDDAFLKLSEHFKNLAEEKDSELLNIGTNVEIKEVNTKKIRYSEREKEAIHAD